MIRCDDKHETAGPRATRAARHHRMYAGLWLRIQGSGRSPQAATARPWAYASIEHERVGVQDLG
jgi:hypothetical protein